MVPDVIIIIVGYKSRGLLRSCLRSFFETSVDSKLKVHVLVVDNASNDGTDEMLRTEYPQVELVINEKNEGFAAAVNRGLARDARYYFLLNPDTYFPEKNLLEGMVAWLEANPSVGMLAPRLRYPNGEIQPSCFRYPKFWAPVCHRTFLGETAWGKRQVLEHLMADFDHETERSVDGVFGAAMLARREAVRVVGPMDNKSFFMFFEDVDWCRRFVLAGWPVMYAPQFTLVHYHGRPSSGSWKAFFTNPVMRMHIKSWLKYFWKWRNGSL